MHNKEQHPYTEWVDLAGRKLGGQVLSCSDDFFAEMENLIKPEAPVFIADKYKIIPNSKVCFFLEYSFGIEFFFKHSKL